MYVGCVIDRVQLYKDQLQYIKAKVSTILPTKILREEQQAMQVNESAPRIVGRTNVDMAAKAV